MRLCDLKIEDVAFGGKGVAREQRKVVFVPYTIEGEMVSAEIVRQKKQFAEADVVEVKQSWSKGSRVRRIASRQSARIAADVAAARISISITSISLRLNGDRYARRSR